MRIVDLSQTVAPSPPGVPDFMRNEIEYIDHARGAADYERVFGVPRRLMRDEEGAAAERIDIGTHNVTHVDAPWHYNSTIDGRPAETIDELPLEQFLGPGVVVDVTGREDGDAVTAAQMAAAIETAGHELRAGDIVLVHTGCDAFHEQADYMSRGPGVTPEATRWLYERGVRVMGIDAWSWDQPLARQAREAVERDQTGVFWAAHQVGLRYCQIERLAGLAALPPTGFTVACFPLRIARGSAAPCRAVAILAEPDGAGDPRLL